MYWTSIHGTLHIQQMSRNSRGRKRLCGEWEKETHKNREKKGINKKRTLFQRVRSWFDWLCPWVYLRVYSIDHEFENVRDSAWICWVWHVPSSCQQNALLCICYKRDRRDQTHRDTNNQHHTITRQHVVVRTNISEKSEHLNDFFVWRERERESTIQQKRCPHFAQVMYWQPPSLWTVHSFQKEIQRNSAWKFVQQSWKLKWNWGERERRDVLLVLHFGHSFV
jgi:hypothetical protein